MSHRAGSVVLVALIAALFSPNLRAQSPSLQTASDAYDAKDWKTCARLYGELADQKPPLGYAQIAAVSCLARDGQFDVAFARLTRTTYRDRPPVSVLEKDDDLSLLDKDPRWQRWLDTERKAEAARGYDAALAAELRQRVDRDQDVRKRISQARTPQVQDELYGIDADNTAWLKNIVARQGWPLNRQVGPDGADAAWLLAQHADKDPAFQEQVLELMKAAVAQGEASGSNLAYLTDRVRVAQGKPQVYGTQFHEVDGALEPQPIEDFAHIDARRASVGLGTLAEYGAEAERRSHKKIRWPMPQAR